MSINNELKKTSHNEKTSFYELNEDKSFPIYALYKVNQTEVLVGYRPNIELHRNDDKIHPMNKNLFESIDSFINLSDSYVGYPVHKSSTYLPFDENGSPIYEVLYSALMTLNHQINELKVKRIYIHCDLGSHRAPSIFGLYLFTFHPKQFKKIVNNKILNNIIEKHDPSNPQVLWSNPRNYAKSYLRSKRIFYFLRHLRKNIKNTTSIEGLMRDYRIRPYVLEIYHSRNYTSSLLDGGKMYNSIYFAKKLINSLKKEFPEFLDHLKFNIKRYLYTIPKIEIHILLKTKNGIFWKKNNFGINWKDKKESLFKFLKINS